VEYKQLSVVSNTELALGHWRIELTSPEPLPPIAAGQFLALRCDPGDTCSLLRPFSILSVDREANTLGVYYKHLGRMSKRLSTVVPGERLECLYPLGNSFPWEQGWGSLALIGGGVGLAPMLYLAEWLLKQDPGLELKCFFGGNSEEDLVPALLESYDLPVETATMDGSAGYKGTVIDLYHESADKYQTVYTCGPNPMMAALQGKLPDACQAFASLEEYMACSVGACYGCVVKIKEENGYSNQRVCKEGPVFDLRRVVF